MSNAILSASATGTGSVTLLAPVTNSTQTLTLPDMTGTLLSTATPGVPIGGPAFSAYQSTLQSLPASAATKLQFQTKEFDTNSNFDAATNFRFTPTVAGYYQVNGLWTGTAYNLNGNCYLYKNGSLFKYGPQGGGVNSTAGQAVFALVFMNGTTDYLELYAYNGTGAAYNTTAGSAVTYFQAAMVRSAT